MLTREAPFGASHVPSPEICVDVGLTYPTGCRVADCHPQGGLQDCISPRFQLEVLQLRKDMNSVGIKVRTVAVSNE